MWAISLPCKSRSTTTRTFRCCRTIWRRSFAQSSQPIHFWCFTFSSTMVTAIIVWACTINDIIRYHLKFSLTTPINASNFCSVSIESNKRMTRLSYRPYGEYRHKFVQRIRLAKI